MWQEYLFVISTVLMLAGTSTAQAPAETSADGASASYSKTQPAFTGIPKGSLGPEYVDGSFGFALRPLAGATIDRHKRTIENRMQLAQFVRLEIGWSMSVRLWESERPVDVEAARKDLGANLIFQYPDLSITRAEAVDLGSRSSVRLAASFSNEGQSWLRQQAVVPLHGRNYILITLTSPADDNRIATEAFGHILESFQVIRTRVQQEQLDAALRRGTQLLKNLTVNGKSALTKANPTTYLRTTRDGVPIGFVQIEEGVSTVNHENGLRISQRAWLFNADGSTQYMQEDKFVADNLSYDEWRNLSQFLPAKDSDPKPAMVVSIEGGVRESDQLIVEFSNQAGMMDKKKNKGIQVEGSYAPAAWPLLLPRLVDLNQPELYAFSMYDTDRRGLVMRVFRVLGPAQITVGGRRLSAFRIEDSEGLVPPFSEIYVDQAGRLLRLVSGQIEMSVATQPQIEQEFGPKVKGTVERLQQMSGTSGGANVAGPQNAAPSAQKPTSGRPRPKTSPLKRPLKKPATRQ